MMLLLLLLLATPPSSSCEYERVFADSTRSCSDLVAVLLHIRGFAIVGSVSSRIVLRLLGSVVESPGFTLIEV